MWDVNFDIDNTKVIINGNEIDYKPGNIIFESDDKGEYELRISITKKQRDALMANSKGML